tara:strand:+ start:8687 stop:8965 length:279 start_codon:yes stop_codon:yes gene_type:complete
VSRLAVSLPLEDDPENDRSATPEHVLWCAALAFMLDEARGYWQGARTYGTTGYEGEQAFDDVVRVGPMTRHLCAMTGNCPHWVSERFIKSLG